MDKMFQKAASNYLAKYVALKNDDFILNEENNAKMQKIIAYSEGVINEENGGIIEYCITSPRHKQGEIAVRFTNDFILGMNPEEIEEFSNIVKLCDGINIRGTGLEDGSFLMSFFVENLYTQKDK